MRFKKLSIFAASFVLSGLGFAADSYNHVFLAYSSPADVATLSRYVDANQLGGFIMWTINGDVNPVTDSSRSLLYQLKSAKEQGKQVNAYWTNWSVYGATAIPYEPYAIPGSASTGSSAPVENSDFTNKLPYISGLVYSFLEAVTDGDQLGMLYFNDPWADLQPDDDFCLDSATSASCTYAVKSGKTFKSSAYMGNFEAFSALRSDHPKLNLLMAVGGYAHDSSFENTFVSEQGITNFVNSAVAIMNHYRIQGIDLDYENPDMTQEQSQRFLQLVTALNAKLGDDQFINITMLSDPDYIHGVRNGSHGFAPNVLMGLNGLVHVQRFDLMTYDFHGAFDYTADGRGRTGFMSNVYQPANVPVGYDPQFSVQQAVQAMLDLGIPAAKINVGVSAYGRALAGISAGVDGTGLFQVIPSDARVLPGDWDEPNCETALPVTANSCSGVFSYAYIVNHLLTNGFAVTDWQDDVAGDYNASTAYATSFAPTQAANYSLEVTNTGAGLGVIVEVGSFISDWLAPAAGKTYDNKTNPSVSVINGQGGLVVTWKTYDGGPSGSCGSLDFSANTHIMINPDTRVCEIK